MLKMKIKFTKMQAFGNDYVYIDAIHQQLSNLNELAIWLSDRHFGIGGDGMVLICPSEYCDFRMRIFNPDGTEAEMCGNALRSTAMFAYFHGLTQKEKLTIETLGGNKIVYLETEQGKVINIHAMIGAPQLAAAKVPVITGQSIFLNQPINVLGRTYLASCISWGNPHTVIAEDTLDQLEIEKYGPAIENHALFPARTNVTFAQVVDRNHIRIREWERGCGETIGCGTGCCSAVVVLHMLGLCERRVEVEQIGGVLLVEWDDRNEVHMIGPSHVVYQGECEV